MKLQTRRHWHLKASLFAFLLVVAPLLQINSIRAQGPNPPTAADNDPATPLSQLLRLEKIDVPGGAELITVEAKLSNVESDKNDRWIPLVSILRDTLGDQNPENDRLRYVWPLTYTRPTTKQKLAAAIPFFYTRIDNKDGSSKTPPPALDLAAPESDVWNKVLWAALQNILLDPYGTPIKASTSSYRRNTSDYRKSHIIRALAVLSLYEAVEGEKPLSDSEMATIQARLLLTDKTFGGLVDDANLRGYYAKKTTQVRDERAHNWELLRQRAEAESLYFEPLSMPDGSATHALLWVAKRDLLKQQGARYNGRFLNIANPWNDKRLLNWQGYVETRYFDAENQTVSSDTPGAQPVEMIPLGLYGLDNPKIPMLLVDFRASYNPKTREMSRRVLSDITRNVLSLSKFGNLPFFLGRTVFDFVTGRRGIDINQPSRLATYSQLKLLLALNNSLEPELREEIGGRAEKISLNPFENNLESEANVAIEQYRALEAFAKDPSGLAAKIERDLIAPTQDYIRTCIDAAVAVEGGEVDPGGDVARAQLEADAGGRQRPPADLVGERVVAEQPEVAGAGPRGDAAGDRVVQAEGAFAGQPVEVGRARLGQLRAALDGAVAAEAVHHQQQRLVALWSGHLGHDGLGGERHLRLRTCGGGTGRSLAVGGRRAGRPGAREDPQESRPVDRRANPPAPGR